ncbi:MAG TPA: response regulator [Gemmatimonadales bacterium]|nr:response regulator [Gemmatimonadales bacterium]
MTSKKAPEAAGQAKKRRILIVDDSSTHRLWLELMLGSRYDIDVAVDGEGGLKAAAANKPDLILLDVVMPGVDGFTTCRALRERAATRKTPVIMVTTKDEEIDVETGYTSGCTDYIAKPVDQIELLAKVESWLDAAGAA